MLMLLFLLDIKLGSSSPSFPARKEETVRRVHKSPPLGLENPAAAAAARSRGSGPGERNQQFYPHAGLMRPSSELGSQVQVLRNKNVVKNQTKKSPNSRNTLLQRHIEGIKPHITKSQSWKKATTASRTSDHVAAIPIGEVDLQHLLEERVGSHAGVGRPHARPQERYATRGKLWALRSRWIPALGCDSRASPILFVKSGIGGNREVGTRLHTAFL
ncbi:hypothetical protein CDEST_11586 [Colletotrichum destructivum]|uniref:Uncharacterized protein n=1 Tax=Colletotrichum destructivum TaxID=34406 RepID=A0AAX4ITM7_9PEZI|nr:hypothetical protein CDEST_11586 [Colletotrichum destructivum]